MADDGHIGLLMATTCIVMFFLEKWNNRSKDLCFYGVVNTNIRIAFAEFSDTLRNLMRNLKA